MAADGAHVAAAPEPDEARAAPALPRHPLARRLTGWLFWFVIVAVLAWAWTPAEMYRAADLIHDWRNMATCGSAFLRPNFHDWDSYLADMLVTRCLGNGARSLIRRAVLDSQRRQCLPRLGCAAGAPVDGCMPRHQRDGVRPDVRSRGRSRSVR